MRLTSTIVVVCAVLLSLLPVGGVAIGPHASLARRHMRHYHELKHKLRKRGECEFPTDKGLVPVTPDAMNAGWAMSPDQPCKPGMYCPYACPPGQLMGQWDPEATSYSYPESMNGGLYCNHDGEIELPFPNKPLCYDGTGSFSAKNLAGDPIAICQTVLPGNEAMLIPTVVDSEEVLAVPDTSYWCGTAAHYYINPPGVSAEEGCVWGSNANPYGNWSPYVTGANQDGTGQTFVKIGWNPIYLEPDVPFKNVLPTWGVRIECEGGECGGLPCEIDPAIHKVNEVANMHGPGAGGANFCVVGVPKGATAKLVIFSRGDSSTANSQGDEQSAQSDETPETTTSAGPTPTPTPQYKTSTTAATTSETATTTTSETTTSETTSPDRTSSVASTVKSSTSWPSTTCTDITSTGSYDTTIETPYPVHDLFDEDNAHIGGVLVANNNTRDGIASNSASSTATAYNPAATLGTEKGAGSTVTVSRVGLLFSGFVLLVVTTL